MPLAAIAAIGAVGSLAGGAIAAHGANSAANAQSNAAMSAANLQHQDAQAALNFNQQQFNTQQQNMAPWLGVGRSGLANLASLLGILPPDSTTQMGSQTGANPQQGGGTVPFSTFLRNGDFSDATGRGRVAEARDAYNSQFGSQSPYALTEATPGQGGQVSLSSLVNPSLGAPGSLAQGWNQEFKAPDAVTEQNDPGYQFRLQQGQDALEHSAAARGGLLNGGTGKALQQYGQDYASNEYGNVYNRALGQYQQSYNVFQNNQTNQFNRLAALAGVGQTAAAQLGSLGQQAAGNNTNILLGSGAQIGQDLNNAGAARASGYVGGANAIGGAIGGIGSNLTQLMLMKNLLGGGSGGNSNPWGSMTF